MPQVIVSRKPFDSVFLQPWIQTALTQHDPRLGDSIIPSVPIEDLGQPELSSKVLSNIRHFVKVTKFFNVDCYTVYASIRDSKVQMLS
ncbi:hypothetical protein ZYGR_0AI02220 [Zygosaccharomyces rouxii]|uniref:Telomere replication protein EST3 n=1 Tax=Zygosaccharomyces rouxii TaxID=4956 RepID=A0A1Q3ABE6_ZYGRO|nr:hypothetical protein ZYGR_0AI02220 [Zygosaccharomyces rouxii]